MNDNVHYAILHNINNPDKQQYFPLKGAEWLPIFFSLKVHKLEGIFSFFLKHFNQQLLAQGIIMITRFARSFASIMYYM